jgi:hypothetical protein
MASDTYGADDQDGAEAFDEDNQNLDGEGQIEGEMRTFEELPDVLDVTQAAGDSDDDVALTSDDLVGDEALLEAEADADSTDIEDDDLAGRMPEAFDDDSLREGEVEELPVEGETGLDARDNDDDLAGPASEYAMSVPDADDVPLELSGDTDVQSEQADEANPADLESDTLDDADLKDLGYQDGRRKT